MTRRARDSIPILFGFSLHEQLADLRKRCDFSNDPRFEVLRGKIPLSPAQVESQLTLAEINNERPTPTERAALFDHDQVGAVCTHEAMDIASRGPRTTHQ
jgi:hypothetical protein